MLIPCLWICVCVELCPPFFFSVIPLLCSCVWCSAALKAAHVGVSLSESESSIAAPFTCTTPNISCIPALLRHGRGALVTSFQLFRFIATYSMIQCVAVVGLWFLSFHRHVFQWIFSNLPPHIFVPLFAHVCMRAYTRIRTQSLSRTHIHSLSLSFSLFLSLSPPKKHSDLLP